MKTGRNGSTLYLALDGLAADRRLAQRLPADLARRYHALPVAEDGGLITVAIANPLDTAARDAIASALGSAPFAEESATSIYLVQGDRASIDALVTDIWPDVTVQAPVVALYPPQAEAGSELLAYAEGICELVGGALQIASMPEQADLLIVAGDDVATLERLLRGQARILSNGRRTQSLLLARQPRWPLHRLLLVLRGAPCDEAALDWAERLARSAGRAAPEPAAVAVLSIVPQMPEMYAGLKQMQQDVAALLSSNTMLGRNLRQAARRLAEADLQGALLVRQGAPDVELAREIEQGDHDLVIVAGEAPHRWHRWLAGDLLPGLLHWIDRPLFLARPISALASDARQATG